MTQFVTYISLQHIGNGFDHLLRHSGEEEGGVGVRGEETSQNLTILYLMGDDKCAEVEREFFAAGFHKGLVHVTEGLLGR